MAGTEYLAVLVEQLQQRQASQAHGRRGPVEQVLSLLRYAGKRRSEGVVVGQRRGERVQLLLRGCSRALEVGVDGAADDVELPFVQLAQPSRDLVAKAERQKGER